MKRTKVLTGALILALTATALPLAAQDRGDGPRGPRGPMFDFSAADTDGDGKVTQDEMTAARAARFAEADTNGDGVLSVEELVARAEAQRAQRMNDRMQGMIERMDTDGDGMLSAEEMDPPRSAMMFSRLDRDDDGAISEDELAQARERFGDRAKKMERRHGEHGEHGKRWMKGHRDN